MSVRSEDIGAVDFVVACRIGPDGCREYARRYFHAAQARRRRPIAGGKQTWGYRAWMEAAWDYRGFARFIDEVREDSDRG